MRKNPWSELMSNVKKSKSRTEGNSKKSVEITEKDLQEQFKKQDRRCYWLGLRLTPTDIFKTYYPLAMSVDRIDNDKGYVVGNIVISCRMANLGRGRYEHDDFKKVIKKIKGALKNAKV